MKFAVGLFGLSVVVMVFMIFQALRQEFILRNLKTRMAENTADVKRKEQTIVEVKNKIKEMKTTLETVSGQIEELSKKKAGLEKSTKDFDKDLHSCNDEKADAERRNVDVAQAMDKLKTKHEESAAIAKKEIQSLKQQILDRDKAICAFADTTKEEARKLCDIPEAPK
uniref:uncharacterized protein si:dkey-87o1.2 n=1 Tax=Scatophagus argus TaxID=75038 RepID=UPI001ED7D334|nr:uncharacterized protein si:dkey-87o1.2 [Scatophagus argus]